MKNVTTAECACDSVATQDDPLPHRPCPPTLLIYPTARSPPLKRSRRSLLGHLLRSILSVPSGLLSMPALCMWCDSCVVCLRSLESTVLPYCVGQCMLDCVHDPRMSYECAVGKLSLVGCAIGAMSLLADAGFSFLSLCRTESQSTVCRPIMQGAGTPHVMHCECQFTRQRLGHAEVPGPPVVICSNMEHTQFDIP